MATRIIGSSPRHAAAARVYGSIIMPTGGLAMGTTPVRSGRADVAASASTIARARPNTSTDAATPNRTRGAGTVIRGRLPAPLGCKTHSHKERSIRMRGTRTAGAIDAFQSVENQFDSYVKNAPSEVKADAQKQVDAARKAIKDNNATQFQTDQD